MKFRITRTVEYEVDPRNYQADQTPEQMLAVDLREAAEDPFFLAQFTAAVEDTKITITGEVIA